MDEKIEKFYAKADKHGGLQQVPAQRIYCIFEEILRLPEVQFVSPKRGWLARQINSEIIQVIKLQALKGGAYGLSSGLALSYVPYPYVPKLKWHRTLKSLWLDLPEQPQPDWNTDAEAYQASGTLGEKCFREELERIWRRCSWRIASWFDATLTLEGVLAKCDEHLRRKPGGVRHLPGPRLVRAFTLAKIGRLNAAKADLEIFMNENQEGPQASDNLNHALDEVASQ